MSWFKDWRLPVIISGAVLFGVLLFGAMEYTSRPDFCISCHEMEPMYSSWRLSSHRETSCLKCHADPGAAGFVRTKVKALGEVYLHFTGTYKKPITIKTETRTFSDRCLRCHENIKGKGRPHNLTHFAMEMACTSCHRGVVHDPDRNRRPPSYNICVKCHGEEMAEEREERQE